MTTWHDIDELQKENEKLKDALTESLTILKFVRTIIYLDNLMEFDALIDTFKRKFYDDKQ